MGGSYKDLERNMIGRFHNYFVFVFWCIGDSSNILISVGKLLKRINNCFFCEHAHIINIEIHFVGICIYYFVICSFMAVLLYFVFKCIKIFIFNDIWPGSADLGYYWCAINLIGYFENVIFLFFWLLVFLFSVFVVELEEIADSWCQ